MLVPGFIRVREADVSAIFGFDILVPPVHEPRRPGSVEKQRNGHGCINIEGVRIINVKKEIRSLHALASIYLDNFRKPPARPGVRTE